LRLLAGFHTVTQTLLNNRSRFTQKHYIAYLLSLELDVLLTVPLTITIVSRYRKRARTLYVHLPLLWLSVPALVSLAHFSVPLFWQLFGRTRSVLILKALFWMACSGGLSGVKEEWSKKSK